MEEGGLMKKTVRYLDKYLLHHNMKAALILKKKQKVVAITQHLSNYLLEELDTNKATKHNSKSKLPIDNVIQQNIGCIDLDLHDEDEMDAIIIKI